MGLFFATNKIEPIPITPIPITIFQPSVCSHSKNDILNYSTRMFACNNRIWLIWYLFVSGMTNNGKNGSFENFYDID
jgi:hypothetical protein